MRAAPSRSRGTSAKSPAGAPPAAAALDPAAAGPPLAASSDAADIITALVRRHGASELKGWLQQRHAALDSRLEALSRDLAIPVGAKPPTPLQAAADAATVAVGSRQASTALRGVSTLAPPAPSTTTATAPAVVAPVAAVVAPPRILGAPVTATLQQAASSASQHAFGGLGFSGSAPAPLARGPPIVAAPVPLVTLPTPTAGPPTAPQQTTAPLGPEGAGRAEAAAADLPSVAPPAGQPPPPPSGGADSVLAAVRASLGVPSSTTSSASNVYSRVAADGQRVFADFDESGTGMVGTADFKDAVMLMGHDLTRGELTALQAAFAAGRGPKGSLDYRLFLAALLPQPTAAPVPAAQATAAATAGATAITQPNAVESAPSIRSTPVVAPVSHQSTGAAPAAAAPVVPAAVPVPASRRPSLQPAMAAKVSAAAAADAPVAPVSITAVAAPAAPAATGVLPLPPAGAVAAPVQTTPVAPAISTLLVKAPGSALPLLGGLGVAAPVAALPCADPALGAAVDANRDTSQPSAITPVPPAQDASEQPHSTPATAASGSPAPPGDAAVQQLPLLTAAPLGPERPSRQRAVSQVTPTDATPLQSDTTEAAQTAAAAASGGAAQQPVRDGDGAALTAAPLVASVYAVSASSPADTPVPPAGIDGLLPRDREVAVPETATSSAVVDSRAARAPYATVVPWPGAPQSFVPPGYMHAMGPYGPYAAMGEALPYAAPPLAFGLYPGDATAMDASRSMSVGATLPPPPLPLQATSTAAAANPVVLSAVRRLLDEHAAMKRELATVNDEIPAVFETLEDMKWRCKELEEEKRSLQIANAVMQQQHSLGQDKFLQATLAQSQMLAMTALRLSMAAPGPAVGPLGGLAPAAAFPPAVPFTPANGVVAPVPLPPIAASAWIDSTIPPARRPLPGYDAPVPHPHLQALRDAWNTIAYATPTQVRMATVQPQAPAGTSTPSAQTASVVPALPPAPLSAAAAYATSSTCSGADDDDDAMTHSTTQSAPAVPALRVDVELLKQSRSSARTALDARLLVPAREDGARHSASPRDTPRHSVATALPLPSDDMATLLASFARPSHLPPPRTSATDHGATTSAFAAVTPTRSGPRSQIRRPVTVVHQHTRPRHVVNSLEVVGHGVGADVVTAPAPQRVAAGRLPAPAPVTSRLRPFDHQRTRQVPREPHTAVIALPKRPAWAAAPPAEPPRAATQPTTHPTPAPTASSAPPPRSVPVPPLRLEAISAEEPPVASSASAPSPTVAGAGAPLLAPKPHHKLPTTLAEMFPRATSNEYVLRQAVRTALNHKLRFIGLGTSVAPVSTAASAAHTGGTTTPAAETDAEEAAAALHVTAPADGALQASKGLERVAVEALSLAFEVHEPKDDADLIKTSAPGTRITKMHRQKYQHTLSPFDFFQALKAMGVAVHPRQVTRAIGNLDLDVDGRVDYRSFVRFVSMPATPPDLMRMAAVSAAAEFVEDGGAVAATGLKPTAALKLEAAEADAKAANDAFARLGDASPGKLKVAAAKVPSPPPPSAWAFAAPGSHAAGMRPKFSCAWPIEFNNKASPFWAAVNGLEGAVLREVRKRATVEATSPEPSATFSLAARYGVTGVAATPGAFILRRAFAFFDRRNVRSFTLDDFHETLADLGLVDPPYRVHTALTPFIKHSSTLRDSAEALFTVAGAPGAAPPAESDDAAAARTAAMSPQEKLLPDVPDSPIAGAMTPVSARSRSGSPHSRSGASSRASSPALELQVSSAARKIVAAVFRRMHGEGDPGIPSMAVQASTISASLFEDSHPILQEPVNYNSFAKWAVPLNGKLKAVCEKMQTAFNTLATRGGGAKDFLAAFKRISGGRKFDETMGVTDIRALLGSAAVNLTNSEIQTLIDWFDENGNGAIDMFELFTGALHGWDLGPLVETARAQAAEADAAMDAYVGGPVAGTGAGVRGRSTSPVKRVTL